MKSKLLLTLAVALVAFAPAVRANWNPDSNVLVVAQDDDDDKKEREREQKERDQERAEQKVEKEEDVYDRATDSLDDHDWRRAMSLVQKVADMDMSHAAAALHRKASAQRTLGAL